MSQASRGIVRRYEIVTVFPAGPQGGNPAPIVVNADGMTDDDMRSIARETGHESAFVFSAPPNSGHDFEFRFWVPNHEMEMCGHATVGATWLLAQSDRLVGGRLNILTRSGSVQAIVHRLVDTTSVEISQPVGRLERVDPSEVSAIADAVGISLSDLASYPVLNAATSRIKTLIPVRSVALLDGLKPKLDRIESLCEHIGSTGLYPYAPLDRDKQIFDARQFPKSSGYPEDAATGIAATALCFGLLECGLIDDVKRPVTVRQGRAMERPSEITVRLDLAAGDGVGCWLSGQVDRSYGQPGGV
jgi:PhzF family phenazine biosynthesis protein